jgi:predicted aconitase with swiveling domain
MKNTFYGKRVVEGINHSKVHSVDGIITAPIIVCQESFSFLGDVDIKTSEIINPNNKNFGVPMMNKILAFYSSKGSSSGCVILSSMVKKGIGPLAIVTLEPADYNLVEGAILAQVPFLAEIEADFFTKTKTGMLVSLNKNYCIIKNEELS